MGIPPELWDTTEALTNFVGVFSPHPNFRLSLLITTWVLSLGLPRSNIRLSKQSGVYFKTPPLHLPSLSLLLFKSSIHVGIAFNAT